MGWAETEVMTMRTLEKQPDARPPDDDLPFDELAKRQGATPVGSLAEPAQPGLSESDEECDAFLALTSTPRDAPAGVTPVVLDTDVASALLKERLPGSVVARLSGRPLATTFPWARRQMSSGWNGSRRGLRAER
jgi:hypothetical protein